MSFTEVLAHTLSSDQQVREEATRKLESASQENFAAYTVLLCQELANEQTPGYIRSAAGIALKNSLISRDASLKQQLSQKWLGIDAQTRLQVKQALLMTLNSNDSQASGVSAQAISTIAAIELPHGDWLDLINTLLNNMTTSTNANLKKSTLNTIGYICESIDPNIVTAQANQILTAIVQGARKEEPSHEVRYAAIRALINSLEFVRDNFEREGERNYIMQVVCEATQSPEVDVQAASFECLVKIMSLYYDKMEFYMEKALFSLTVLGMKHEDDNVALQAVEFWSTVCDAEIELNYDAQEAQELGDQPENVSLKFAERALPQVIPTLLWLLTKQDEDADEDEWNVSMASATCLSLFAQNVTDAIVAPVIPFVESHIRNADWHYREAAIMAFGSILDGPQSPLLAPLVSQALPVLIEMLKDPVVHVKDTAAWTIGRVCDQLIDCIQIDVHLHPLVSALVAGLEDSPRVISNCCWSIMNLTSQLSNDSEAPTYALSQYFQGLIATLLRVTDRSNNENNSRTSGYEAISSLVANSALDCMPLISQLAITILERLEVTINQTDQIVGTDEKNELLEHQSNLCGVLTHITRRLNKDTHHISDRLMTGLLQILTKSGKHSTILEDVFLTIGAAITALETGFVRYLQHFNPFLCNALANHEEYQLCSIAVGLIGDICRSMGDQAIPYCDEWMNHLIQNLQSPILNRSVKPVILSCLGDIALAIGASFEKYVEVVFVLLQQACAVCVNPATNYDNIDYNNLLREGILEAFVGIVQGLKSGHRVELLHPYVNNIFLFMQMVFKDPEYSNDVLRIMIGLLGDMGEAFSDGRFKEQFKQPWVLECIRAAKINRSLSGTTRDIARWAREMVKRASN